MRVVPPTPPCLLSFKPFKQFQIVHQHTMNSSPRKKDSEKESSVQKYGERQKVLQENARTNTANKITAIIDKEFPKEIEAKEKEVIKVQEQLQKALKRLHFLRCMIVKNYYHRKQCQLQDVPKTNQTRIHPAIKGVTGKSPKQIQGNFFLVDSTQSTSNDANFAVPEVPNKCPKKSKNETSTKKDIKRNCDENTNNDEPPKKIPRYIPPKISVPESAGPSRRTQKVKKIIKIWALSKFIREEERDDESKNISHIWKICVDSVEENVKIDEFVDKVKFTLDSSYKPNDVVLVSSSPFHLVRRGWGSFPLRIQLCLKNPDRNPKVDFTHHLILDKTYSGLWTIGNESFVDIWIDNPESRISSISEDANSTENCPNQDENDLQNEGFKSEQSNGTQEDEELKFLKNSINNDHSYVLRDMVIDNHRRIVHVPNNITEKSNAEISCRGSTNSEVKENGASLMNDEQMTEEEFATLTQNMSQRPNKLTNVTQQRNVQNMAFDFKEQPAKLEPLNIVIPQNGEVSKKKLILKNNQMLPMKSENSAPPGNGVNEIAKVTGKGGENGNPVVIESKNSFLFNTKNCIPALQISGDSFSKKDEEYLDEEVLGFIKNKTMDVEYVVKCIARKLPFITEEAYDPEYKKRHPYACSNLTEFWQSNIGKRKSLEWYYAKTLRLLMEKAQVPEEDLWTVKELIIWAKEHGHIPLTTSGTENFLGHGEEQDSKNSQLVSQTEPIELKEWLTECDNTVKDPRVDAEIDIEDERVGYEENHHAVEGVPSEIENTGYLEIPEKLHNLRTFVEKSVEDIGLRLGTEMIVPGVEHCSAARVIMQSVHCLIDDLLRLSLNKAFERQSRNESGNENSLSIEPSDVRKGLTMREEFDLFTNAGLGSKIRKQ